jgi:hypothetical protein
MARIRGPLRAALLILLALLIAFGAAAPAFAADARDPRCEDWEAALTPPPGIDMSVLCPAAAVRTEAVDLDKEPLLPYVVGLVVMAAVLAAFGVVAMRVTSPKKGRARPAADWWACPACGVRNRPDRATCFACQASRADAPAHPAATTEAALPTEDPHPV